MYNEDTDKTVTELFVAKKELTRVYTGIVEYLDGPEDYDSNRIEYGITSAITAIETKIKKLSLEKMRETE